MENLFIAFQVVFPLFFIIAGGYGVVRAQWLTKDACEQLNRLVFRLCVPFLLFSNLYYADGSQGASPQFICTAIGLVLVTFSISCGVVFRLVKENPRRGVIVQGLYRTNFLIFALSMTEALYGQEGRSLASMLVVVVVPLYNVIAVCLLERCRGEALNLKKLFRQIISNPFIYSAFLGMIVRWWNIPIYAGLLKGIDDVAGVATPLMLFSVGTSFDFSSVKKNRNIISLVVLFRLLLIPALLLWFCVAMGFRDVQLAILLSLVSTPTAVASYSMASQMGGDSQLAGQLVVFTTLFSAVTLVFWIFLFKQLGLF